MRQAVTPGSRDRWLDERSYPRSWNKRGRVVARYCSHRFVCDIGCGRMSLDRYLPLGTRYLPSDLKQWTPEVELCDLSAKILPERYLALCDVACLLGVVERIEDLDWLFSSLARRAEHLIVTYHCIENAPTRPFDWINALTTAEFSAKLAAAGYTVEKTPMFRSQTIFVAHSLVFTEVQKKEREATQKKSLIAPSRATMLRRLVAKVSTRAGPWYPW